MTSAREPAATQADDGLFDGFVRRESPALLRLAWGLAGSRAGAEDLVQTALERVWLRWSRVRDKVGAGAYARRVLVSVFLTSRRRRWSGERATDHVPDQPVGDAAELVAVRRSVVAALHTLPARQRAVVVLRYLDDRTETQTAAALGCSVGTVKSQTSRAMAALRASPHLAEVWGSRAEAAP